MEERTFTEGEVILAIRLAVRGLMGAISRDEAEVLFNCIPENLAGILINEITTSKSKARKITIRSSIIMHAFSLN